MSLGRYVDPSRKGPALEEVPISRGDEAPSSLHKRASYLIVALAPPVHWAGPGLAGQRDT